MSGFAKLIGQLGCAHFGLEIVRRHLGTRNENARLALVLDLPASIKEERDVRILLRFCRTKLRKSAPADDLAERIRQIHFRERDGMLKFFVVRRKRGVMEIQPFTPIEAIEHLIGQGSGELAGTV